MCMDYRRLNATTRKDDESLDALDGAHYFSATDLVSAKNHLEVYPDNQHRQYSPHQWACFHTIKCPLDCVMHLPFFKD